VNAVTYYQSGFPLAIVQTDVNSVLGAAVQRPNINPAFHWLLRKHLLALVGYINPSAFTAVPEFAFGNAPRPQPPCAPRGRVGQLGRIPAQEHSGA